ncbi:MAG: DNA internalization-related competence protein ComEC/Rec2 [Nitrospirae bacterium]|nr:DNA internalization-related competence protein ComEC/Rec2 [Nitrospirota bacterium]
MKRGPDPLYYPLSFLCGFLASWLFRYFPLTVFLILLAVLFVLFRRVERPVLLVIAFLICFLYGFTYFENIKAKEAEILAINTNEAEIYIEAITDDLPKRTRRGYLQKVELISPSIEYGAFYLSTPAMPGPNQRVWGWVHLYRHSNGISPGIKTSETVILRPVRLFSEPTSRGFQGLGDKLRWRLYRKLDELFDADVAALLKAILIGHRDSASGALYRAFSNTGLAHLMSISGTHFGLFALIVFFVIRQMARLLPYRVLIRLTGRLSLNEYAALMTVPFLVFYLMLSGARIPALRSFIMIMFFLVGLLYGKHSNWRYALVSAALIILIIDPAAIASASFLLSFSAVWFIGGSFELVRGYLSDRPSRARAYILKLLVTPAAALVGTLGLTVFYFHRGSVISLPMNMVVTPVVGFLLLPVSLFSALVYLVAGVFPLSGFLDVFASGIIDFVRYVSLYKGAVIKIRALPVAVIMWWYVMLVFVFLKKRRAVVLAVSGLILSVIVSFKVYEFQRPMVTFLDVGQADSAVIETEDNKTVVVDTGTNAKVTEAYLAYMGKDKIDAVVLSHAGSDHAGGVYHLIRSFDVEELWDNGELVYNPRPEVRRIRHLEAGDLISTQRAAFLFLHPYRGYYNRSGDDENNHSLVMKYTEGLLSVLFTGDIEADAEKDLSELGNMLRATVLKVPHHGSYTSTTEEFLRMVSPEMAIISLGRSNRYGHPHKEVLERLRNIKLFRTDQDGSIRIYLDGSGNLRVARYRDVLFKDLTERYSLKAEVKNIKRLFMVW